MNDGDIHKIIFSKSISGTDRGEFELRETHISWILLYGKFAYKIKKPVHLPFLDFSTLQQRKFFCEREVILNSRFSKGIYFKVVPIKKYQNHIFIGKSKGEIIDYAVMMRRLNSGKQMDIMLRENKVAKIQILKLAKKISSFHRKAAIIKNKFNPLSFQDLFSELSCYKKFIRKYLGNNYYGIVSKAQKKSKLFLSHHRKMLDDRVERGLVRDCHGDLHSGNIFLYSSPVLFDCIEFNDEFRYIDVLYEIAFLSMDLDFYGKFKLGRLFEKDYLSDSGLSMNKKELQLFYYYKTCRANIRAKVNIIKALEIKKKDNEFKNIILETKNYLDLIKVYSNYY
jgi:uncharacterized protein